MEKKSSKLLISLKLFKITNTIFRIKVGISKSNHLPNLNKINQKGMSSNAKNSILDKMLKIGTTPKRLELDTISKSSKNLQFQFFSI